MIGLYFENKCLVTRSYKEDGIFFLIYLITIILFLVKKYIGKYIAIGLMSQFETVDQMSGILGWFLENEKGWQPHIVFVGEIIEVRDER